MEWGGSKISGWLEFFFTLDFKSLLKSWIDYRNDTCEVFSE